MYYKADFLWKSIQHYISQNINNLREENSRLDKDSNRGLQLYALAQWPEPDSNPGRGENFFS